MAEAGLQAPNILALQAPQTQQHPTQQEQQQLHLNWSHFKPKFSGKPEEEEAEAHLLMIG